MLPTCKWIKPLVVKSTRACPSAILSRQAQWRAGTADIHHVAHPHSLALPSLVTIRDFKKVFQLLHAPFELFFPLLRILKLLFQRRLVPPHISFASFKLRNSPMEEIVDDFQFADSCLEGGVLIEQRVVRLRWMKA